MYLIRSLFAAFSFIAVATGGAGACRCYDEPSIERSLSGSDVAVESYIYNEVRHVHGYYRAKVKRLYKGCDIKQYDRILINAGSNSCGVQLHKRSRYVLFGTVSQEHVKGYRGLQTVLTLNGCDANTLIYHVSRSDRRMLRKFGSNSCNRVKPVDPKVPYGARGCSRSDCGRLPYDTSPIHCPDGSVAGFTNNCIESTSGGGGKNRCEWEFLKCPVCHKDADCSDGKICNGDGYCSPAECQVDSNCGPNEQCKNGRCVKCDCGTPTQPFLCHDGHTYGGEAKECRLDYGACSWTYSTCPACNVDSDCVAIENGVCREGTCERGECSVHHDCENDQVCENGYCVDCNCGHPGRTEFQCDDGRTYGDRSDGCTRKHGRCEHVYTECAPCGSNEDCLGVDFGICKNGQCEEGECFNDDDCKGTEVCEHGQCEACECYSDQESFLCHDKVNKGGEAHDCRRRNGQCAYAYTDCADCQTDQDCSALDKGICFQGQCASAQCLDDHHCADDEVCENNKCVPCNCGPPSDSFICHDKVNYGGEPIDCSRNNNGQCSWSYSSCGDCNTDQDCSALDKGICVDGQCASAQCLDDNHCADDEVCENNQCVPCNCGPPSASFICHDKVNYGGEPIDCSRNNNGQCSWSYSSCGDCNADQDCSALNKGICVGGQCASAQCLDDNHCADDEVCEDYKCVPCNCGPTSDSFLCHDKVNYGGEPIDCSRNNNGQCSWSYSSCGDCNTDQDCSALNKGICVDGQCASAQCLDDNHCADDEVCENNQCVPCNCGPPSDSFLCHDKVNYGGEPIDCSRNNNGQCSWSYSSCGECSSDVDCSALDFGTCSDGECLSLECRVSSDCNSESEYCDDGKCVECNCGRPQGRSRCSDGVSFTGPDKCLFNGDSCQWTYTTCPVCDIDYTCPRGFECQSGECVPVDVCDSNSDCEGDQYCDYGKCVDCDCGAHFGDDQKEQCADGRTIGGFTGACRHTGHKCEWEFIECPRCHGDYDCASGLHCVDGFCSAADPYNGKCGRDEDCKHGEYCASGECLAIGSCQSHLDCYNPSNDFPFGSLDCVPKFHCSYGRCEARCCDRPADCYIAPCEEQTCHDGKLESCANDYCGGCKARFFQHDGSPTCMGY